MLTLAEILKKFKCNPCIPPQPPLKLEIEVTATQYQILHLNHTHNNTLHVYLAAQKVKEALKNLVTMNIYEMLFLLTDMNLVAILELATHLKGKYYKFLYPTYYIFILLYDWLGLWNHPYHSSLGFGTNPSS